MWSLKYFVEHFADIVYVALTDGETSSPNLDVFIWEKLVWLLTRFKGHRERRNVGKHNISLFIKQAVLLLWNGFIWNHSDKDAKPLCWLSLTQCKIFKCSFQTGRQAVRLLAYVSGCATGLLYDTQQVAWSPSPSKMRKLLPYITWGCLEINLLVFFT